MKKEEVPQNNENLLNGIREIQYAVDENGNYTRVLSYGWEPKNNALKMAVNLVDELIEDARQDVLNGDKSPIWFYMVLKQMDISILKQTTGFSKFKIKRHFNPANFSKLSTGVLEKYSAAFTVSMNDLINIPKEPVDSLKYNFNFNLQNKEID
jgi:hypothetical protein